MEFHFNLSVATLVKSIAILHGETCEKAGISTCICSFLPAKLPNTIFIWIEAPRSKIKCEGGAYFQKSYDQYVIGAADSDNDSVREEDLD